MKNTKNTLLSIAIIAALPFAANATQTIVETNTPAAVGANGTVKKAAATGPYQTATIGEHDDEHIATTAYVKGAYNDAIAAVNKVDDSKQDKLINLDNIPILPMVMGATSALEGIGSSIVTEDDDEYTSVYENLGHTFGLMLNLENRSYEGVLNETLISAGATMNLIREAGQTLEGRMNDRVDDIDASLNDSLADKQSQLTTTVNNQSQNISSTVAQTVNTTTPSATTLVSEAAIASAINGVTTNLSTNYATNTALNSKRVEIYTTWGVDDGTATALVPFATAQ